MKKSFVSITILMFLVVTCYGQVDKSVAQETDTDIPEETKSSLVIIPVMPYSATDVLTLRHPYAAAGQVQGFDDEKWAYPVEPEPRRSGAAIGEVIGINVFIWAMGQYMLDDEGGSHSYINLDTMQHNLTYWFEWDPNHFATNFFLHPYHGGLYFNAARANGFDFWSSTAAAFAGSFMWEMVMERHRPSVNDVIMTTTGGMFLGEALFRFSSLVLDDSKTGWSRTWREIVGALINPVRGLNRLVHGEMSVTRSTPNQIRAPLGLTLYWAANYAAGKEKEFEGGIIPPPGENGEGEDVSGDENVSPYVEALFVYGDAFRGEEKRKPFDFFTMQFRARRTSGELYFSIYAYSLLTGREFGVNENQRHMFGLFQDYDYIYNESIRLGGTTFSPGIMSQFRFSPKAMLTGIAQAGWMILGASNNEYIGSGAGSSAEGIDYNYGMGWSAKVDVAFELFKFGRFLFRWGHYKLWTLEGVDGWDRLNLFQARYRLPVYKGLGLGVELTHYRRNSHYLEFPDVKSRLYTVTGSLSYQF